MKELKWFSMHGFCRKHISDKKTHNESNSGCISGIIKQFRDEDVTTKCFKVTSLSLDCLNNQVLEHNISK